MRKIIVVVMACALLTGVACSKKKASFDAGPAAGTDAAGVTVGTAMGKKPDIQVPTGPAPAGLRVKDIVVGTGAEANAGAQVVAHYVGISWSTRKQFDSSWERGSATPFPLDGVIKGWQQGIPGEKVGGRRLLIVPPDLGYGAQGSPPDIGPNETLVFVVDLVEVTPPPAPPKEGTDGVAVTGALGSKPTVTIPKTAAPTDFVYSDLQVGTGAEVKTGDTVTAHYVGISWSTRKDFDSSWKRGQPATFPLAQVIKGWQLGIPGMKVGGRRLLVIPGPVGYGASPPQGSGIAPNETLVFVVDITATTSGTPTPS